MFPTGKRHDPIEEFDYAGPDALSCGFRMSVGDRPLDVRPREPDLVVEPDLHVAPRRDRTGLGEALPPGVAEPRRVVGMSPEQGPRRSEVDHD